MLAYYVLQMREFIIISMSLLRNFIYFLNNFFFLKIHRTQILNFDFFCIHIKQNKDNQSNLMINYKRKISQSFTDKIFKSQNKQKNIQYLQKIGIYQSNGPNNFMMAQTIQKSQLTAYSNLKQEPSYETLHLGLQSHIQNQLQQKIKNLELKLEKKNQLIKYLEKKCGNQIIKSSKKFQNQIKFLQAQNSNLKKVIQFFGFHQDKKYSLFQSSGGENHIDLALNQTDSYVQYIKNSKMMNYTGYKQEFLNLTSQQLKQIVILQALQIKNFYKQNQFSSFSLIKNKKKDKHLSRTNSKKNSMFLSLTQTSIKDSNQNLNNINIGPLKNNTNLNINTHDLSLNINQIQKKSCSNLPTTCSHRVLYQPKEVSTQTQFVIYQDQINQTQTAEKIQVCIQSQIIQQINQTTQTEESMQDIEDMLKYVQILKNENRSLLYQNQMNKIENNCLKNQVNSFSERIQDYCVQLLRQPSQISQQLQRSENRNNLHNIMLTILDGYNQILQIFGLQTITPDFIQKCIQQTQKRLINQICNMKLQISQIVKQFRKVQKQLNQTFYKKNNLQNQVKWLQQKLQQTAHQNTQVNQILEVYNEEIMKVKIKQICHKLQSKYRQLNQDQNLSETSIQISNEKRLSQQYSTQQLVALA